jgi:hypothetical protein
MQYQRDEEPYGWASMPFRSHQGAGDQNLDKFSPPADVDTESADNPTHYRIVAENTRKWLFDCVCKGYLTIPEPSSRQQPELTSFNPETGKSHSLRDNTSDPVTSASAANISAVQIHGNFTPIGNRNHVENVSDSTTTLNVAVMRRSRSRVGVLVQLPHLIEHLLPQLDHRYVM